MAYENFMIGDEVENVAQDGKTTAFRVPLRLPYYRGIVLSLIEGIEVTVDGEAFPREAVSLTVRDHTVPLDELGLDGHTRWEFGEWAAAVVAKDGGLALGEHEVRVVQQLRISYLPWPMRAGATKRVRVVR